MLSDIRGNAHPSPVVRSPKKFEETIDLSPAVADISKVTFKDFLNLISIR